MTLQNNFNQTTTDWMIFHFYLPIVLFPISNDLLVCQFLPDLWMIIMLWALTELVMRGVIENVWWSANLRNRFRPPPSHKTLEYDTNPLTSVLPDLNITHWALCRSPGGPPSVADDLGSTRLFFAHFPLENKNHLSPPPPFSLCFPDDMSQGQHPCEGPTSGGALPQSPSFFACFSYWVVCVAGVGF